MAIVHWVGVGSPNIVVLTRDPTQTSTSTSDLYISTDYGYSFVKKTNLMLQPGTNKPAVLANYYPSHGDKGSDENVSCCAALCVLSVTGARSAVC